MIAENTMMAPAYPLYSAPDGGRQRLSGLFAGRAEAEQAVRDLEALGIPHADISLFYRDENNDLIADDANGTHRAAEAAGVGSAVGGTMGAILGAIAATVGTIVIPGAGILIAGPIAGALAGAGAGGLTGGLVGALSGAGIPHDTARHYETGIHAGGVVVIVDTPSTLIPEVRAILDASNRL